MHRDHTELESWLTCNYSTEKFLATLVLKRIMSKDGSRGSLSNESYGLGCSH